MKKGFHVRLDDNILEKLELLCQEKGVSKAVMIALAIDAYSSIDMETINRRLNYLKEQNEQILSLLNTNHEP